MADRVVDVSVSLNQQTVNSRLIQTMTNYIQELNEVNNILKPQVEIINCILNDISLTNVIETSSTYA